MSFKRVALLMGGAATLALGGGGLAWAQEGPSVSDQTQARDTTTVDDVIVTAQKRSENIRDVGMSIQALPTEALTNAGVTEPKDLVKIVPGFANTPTPFGTNVYTLRGIGYQETSLSAGPAVAIYVDETPIPFSAETVGVALDLRRVEVLKGPQGTLYGQNSTGGLMNFISAPPTDTFQSGIKASYGSFNTLDAEGFISGPLSDTLRARLAVRSITGDGWQKNYTRDDRLGRQDMLNARLLLDWAPTDRFTAQLNLSGWRDHGETPAPQFFGAQVLDPAYAAVTPPGFLAYPAAPHDARAADWDAGQDFSRRNSFFLSSIRLTYQLSSDFSLTSLSSYQKYRRSQLVEGDGTAFENWLTDQGGDITTLYQELRLNGSFGGKGSWLVGVNYEDDKVLDQFQLFDEAGSHSLIVVPDVTGASPSGYVITRLSSNYERTNQEVTSKAVFANVEYPITDSLKLQGSIRYTDTVRDFAGCAYDGGDGSANTAFIALQNLSRVLYGQAPSGQTLGLTDCFSLGAAPTFLFGEHVDRLAEDNVSWRVGANWKIAPNAMLYANASRGYKSGSFPTTIASSVVQMSPVTQESVLAYEVGYKANLMDRTLDLSIAAFDYDYEDKQTLGHAIDPVFGPLLRLINVPKSRVYGFEAAATWRPTTGLTISPIASYTSTKVEGDLTEFDYLGQQQQFGGREFPLVPKWQASLDVQYERSISQGLSAFVGGNLSYQDGSYTGYVPYQEERNPAYTLLDLRAGVEKDQWRLGLWARNVTNEWYWTSSTRINDALVRQVGMPRTVGITLDYRF